MQLSDLLEDFSLPAPSVPAGFSNGSEVAESGAPDQLARFEEGYKAGWDDATSAQAKDARQLSTELAQNLLDLSFTYHEAVAHVVQSTSPILTQMVDLVLPELARKSLGAQIVEQLEEMVRGASNLPVQILIAEENMTAVSDLLDRDFGMPVEVKSGAEMLATQADIRLGDTEIQIDLNEVLSGIRDLVDGFLYENQKAVQHG